MVVATVVVVVAVIVVVRVLVVTTIAVPEVVWVMKDQPTLATANR